LSYQVRYTGEARADLIRLYKFLLDQDPAAAERALETIRKGVDMLESFPFTCRKVDPDNPFLRELVVPFGNTAKYGVLFPESTGARHKQSACNTRPSSRQPCRRKRQRRPVQWRRQPVFDLLSLPASRYKRIYDVEKYRFASGSLGPTPGCWAEP
jgi:hypothetical protein